MGVGCWALSVAASPHLAAATLVGRSPKLSNFHIKNHHHKTHNLCPPRYCAAGRDVKTKAPPPPLNLLSEQLTVPLRLVDELVLEALVWCSLNGLVVGDKLHPSSGKSPGVGLLHAPFSLLPMSFPRIYWDQALELAPIFNELVDRVSMDGEFLQEALSRTREVDSFTSRLLEIHSNMMEMKKKEDIRLGLNRSDYMVDAATKLLLQVELNTISTSSNGLGCRVTDLHRNLVKQHREVLGLDPRSVIGNTAISQHAEALAKAWKECNRKSAVVLVVVQAEERYMYDQYWITVALKALHGVTTIRKTLAAVDAEGEVRPDGTLVVDGMVVSVVYFRAGYSPHDYPSEAEWRARFLIEHSSAVKCPSISYHLVGTKKIQQELAQENVLERFLDNEADVAKVRKCFAGLWSLDNDSIVNSALEKPELFVLKPQREGGGNNVYGDNLRETLTRLQKEGGKELAAYILMQRIFPTDSLAYLVRQGTCLREQAVSEFGIFGAYLRNKDRVIINDQCGYLMRTKAASLNEGGVVAGYAFLNSIFLL